MSETNTAAGAPGEEAEALAALDRIEREVGAGAGFAEARAAGDVCQQYRTIRPFLETALRLVERIPLYGKKIASAIRFLMSIADQFCGSR